MKETNFLKNRVDQPTVSVDLKLARILLVEDSSADADFFQEVMEANKIQYQLQVFQDGEAALNFLLTNEEQKKIQLPDLIFLDLNLPKVNGKELLRNIKSRENLSSIPVVILSGSNNINDIKEVDSLGATDYIVKPISFPKLQQIVSSINNILLKESNEQLNLCSLST